MFGVPRPIPGLVRGDAGGQNVLAACDREGLRAVCGAHGPEPGGGRQGDGRRPAGGVDPAPLARRLGRTRARPHPAAREPRLEAQCTAERLPETAHHSRPGHGNGQAPQPRRAPPLAEILPDRAPQVPEREAPGRAGGLRQSPQHRCEHLPGHPSSAHPLARVAGRPAPCDRLGLSHGIAVHANAI